MITVAVVDDHVLVRDGVVRTISEQADMEVVFAGTVPTRGLRYRSTTPSGVAGPGSG